MENNSNRENGEAIVETLLPNIKYRIKQLVKLNKTNKINAREFELNNLLYEIQQLEIKAVHLINY